jgi:hypothetical protein
MPQGNVATALTAPALSRALRLSGTGDGWLSAADIGILCCGAQAVVARDGGLQPRESGKTSRREYERLAESAESSEGAVPGAHHLQSAARDVTTSHGNDRTET